VSFFNDLSVGTNEPPSVAAQYFGTQGFFADYDARLDKPLTVAMQGVWQEGFDQMRVGTLDPMKLANAVKVAAAKDSPSTNETRGTFLLRCWQQ
jgi:hypothetical protein